MEREERKGGKKEERRRGWEKFEKQEREREKTGLIERQDSECVCVFGD